MTDFIDAVAERAGVDHDRAAEILRAHHVESWTPPPAAARLVLRRVTFSGLRDGTAYEPFSWETGRGVWGIGSADNSVGKTTVLNVIRWLLSGRERVDDAARAMIENAELAVEIGLEQCTISVSGPPGRVTGTVIVGQSEAIPFTNSSFEETMSRIMLPRLGLERSVSWQRFSGSEDGREIGFGWTSLLPGLFVPEASHGVLLGDHAPAAGRLLQMFVGMAWFPTHEAARAALGALAQVRRDSDRRASRDTEAREQRAAALEAELATARARVGTDPSVAASRLEDAARMLDNARRTARETEEELAAATAETADAQSAHLAARRRVHDLTETDAASALFGTLEPTRCPRCEEALGAERLAQEAQHVCSVCDRPQPAAEDDRYARLEEAEAAVIEAAEELGRTVAVNERLQAAHNRAVEVRQDSADQYAAARRAVQGVGDQTQYRLTVARLEGKLEEVASTAGDTSATSGADEERSVLDSAVAEARERMDAPTLLKRLDAEVLAVARRLGLTDITAVALDRGARLTIYKGEVKTSFSKLNLGERLRLKVATVIALLRVGHPSRHPGLIVLDSPAAEEMADPNLDRLLAEIVALSDERKDLQVLIATTRTDALTSALKPEHVRLVPTGSRLW